MKKFMLVVCCVSVLLVSSCSHTAAPATMEGVDNTKLYADLMSDSREGIYRAMAFIEKSGGPSIPAETDTIAQWKEASTSALDWLQSQPQSDAQTLKAQYAQFCRRWAPYYHD